MNSNSNKQTDILESVAEQIFRKFHSKIKIKKKNKPRNQS